MQTYITLEGDVLDLTSLSEAEQAFLQRCYAEYRGGLAWTPFNRLIEGAQNPLMRSTGGWVTAAAWEHPLYRVLQDLADRVGIARGEFRPRADDDLNGDPFDEPGSRASALPTRR